MIWRIRFDVNTVSRMLAFLLSAWLFAISAWWVWTAFSLPLELEIREGTGWLYAIAHRAGVDIYDSSRVTFVNMAHGPLDPIVKGWLATWFPALPGCMITRCFVFLLPFFLLGAAYVVGRKSLTNALFAAAALHLFLVNVTVLMAVGRSDATVLCGLALCCALGHWLLVNRHRRWSSQRYIVFQILLGSSSALVFLANWRIVPMIGTIHLVVLAKQLAESNVRRFRSLLYATVLSAVGWALMCVPTFLFALHGDRREYYRRFFGFYTAASGWGTFPGSEFRLFPEELVQSRQALLWVAAALMAAALFRLRRERAQLVAWLVLLPVGWVMYAYGYYKNQGGGGLHYFCPFFVCAWFLILHGLRRQSSERPLVQLFIVCLLAGLLPWRTVLDQCRQFTDLGAQSRMFLAEVAARTGGRPVFGESTHLFKNMYDDEVVDTGDTVNAIAQAKYFGKEFTRNYEFYTMTLMSEPPRFVIEAMLDPQNLIGITTPQLANMLKNEYSVAVQGPANLVANGGGSIALYERNAE